MRRGRSAVWLLVLLVAVPMGAGAQEVEATSGEDEGLWTKYTNYWDKILERVMDMDLYGGSAQLPKGIFKFKVDYNMRRAVGRFDHHRVGSNSRRLETIAKQRASSADALCHSGGARENSECSSPRARQVPIL